MSQDIIAMAREAGGPQPHDWWHNDTDLERFAALVAAASASVEREACASECDEWIKNGSALAEDIAAAIRARGETK